MLAWPGGPTRQQMLPGNTDSAVIRGLEGGVSYSVRVTALVGDREGAPVSIVVTTRRRSLGWGESGIGLHGLGAGFVLCGLKGEGRMKPGMGKGVGWDWLRSQLGGGASLSPLLSL